MSYKSTCPSINGCKLHLREAGKGRPILFLHGAGSGVMEWLPFFDRLAEAGHLLVPDHPGFGDSDDPSWIKAIPDMAMFYLEMLEELDLHDVHVIGHSLGGWIAAEMAVRNRTRIRDITLMAPAGLRKKGLQYADLFIQTPLERVNALYADKRFVEAQLAKPLSEEDRDKLLKNWFASAKLAWEPRGFSLVLPNWLHRIKNPVRLIWGKDDAVIPSAVSSEWVEKLPSVKYFQMIEQCGHMPHIEKLDEVVGRLIEDIKTSA